MMVGLDAIGHRYGVRPSSLLGAMSPFVALSIDLWAFKWGVQTQNLETQKDRWRANARGRP